MSLLKQPRFVRIMALFLLFCLLAATPIIFMDKIAIFLINEFSDLVISYDKMKGPFFEKENEIEKATVELKKNGFKVTAQKVFFTVDIIRFLRDKELDFKCRMEGVSFVTPDAMPSQNSSEGGIMPLVCSAGKQYDSVTFSIFQDEKTFKISSFRAISTDIRMNGEYISFKESNEVSLDLKIAFSPESSAGVNELVKKNFLSLDEDGWYSTIISYKGNEIFLRGLYALAV